MKNSTEYWDLYSSVKKTVYVVFTGTYAGCYTSHDDACEAAWHSDEPVSEYHNLSYAKSVLKKFTKVNKTKLVSKIN